MTKKLIDKIKNDLKIIDDSLECVYVDKEREDKLRAKYVYLMRGQRLAYKQMISWLESDDDLCRNNFENAISTEDKIKKGRTYWDT